MLKTMVLGIGNPLVGDEGVGVAVAEHLAGSYRFPEEVTVVDAGTMGLGMLALFREHDRVVIVDAVDGTGEPPGTVVLMAPEEIAPNQILHSLHDARLIDVLQAASLVGIEPEVRFVGVQVASMVVTVTELSEDVAPAVELASQAVLSILEGWGIEAARV